MWHFREEKKKQKEERDKIENEREEKKEEQQKDLLICGYTRQKNIQVPVVLTELCKQYYDHYSHWKLENSKYDKFLNLEYKGQTVEIAKFVTESGQDEFSVNVTFLFDPHCFLVKGEWKWPRTSPTLYLALKASPTQSMDSLPINLAGYDINYVIYGNLMNKKLRKTEHFALTDGKHHKIATSFSFEEFKKLNCKLIDLSYYFTISGLTYNKMKTYCCLIRNKNEMRQSNCGINEVFNNWNIKTTLTKRYGSMRQYMRFDIKPNELPNNVKYFQVIYNAKCSRTGEKRYEKIVCDEENSSFSFYMDYYDAFWKGNNKLTITISIEIIKIYDKNCKSIHKRDWTKYGFIKK